MSSLYFARMSLSQEFIEFAIARGVLCFGEFRTKAGRVSPYFFNSGLFQDGASLSALGQFYARAVVGANLELDMLFGPAYKGIPLVASVAIALANLGRNYPYSFNRKEAKDHGEGGVIVGAPLAGRVLILDDVISAGTSVRESVDLIRNSDATPCGVVIALDRMERGQGELSAVQEVNLMHQIPVVSLANLDDLVAYLRGHAAMAENLRAVESYREKYGIFRI